MKNYYEKLEYLKKHQNGLCAIYLKRGQLVPLNSCYKVDLHHAAAHNTKTNRRLYPKFINSLWNFKAASNAAHTTYPSNYWRLGPVELEKRERFLENHPKISNWLNNPCVNLFEALRA